MTYFLDFDRTLFDTDTFITSLRKRAELESFSERLEKAASERRDESVAGQEGRYQLWEEIGNVISLKKGDLSQYLFSDAVEFLKVHGHDTVIVTYGARSLLKQKIDSALNGLPIGAIVHTDDKEKGPFFKDLVLKYSVPHIAVDDLVMQLDSIKMATTGVTCYEMRRDGKPGSGKYPVITNLHQLPQ